MPWVGLLVLRPAVCSQLSIPLHACSPLLIMLVPFLLIWPISLFPSCLSSSIMFSVTLSLTPSCEMKLFSLQLPLCPLAPKHVQEDTLEPKARQPCGKSPHFNAGTLVVLMGLECDECFHLCSPLYIIHFFKKAIFKPLTICRCKLVVGRWW